MVTKFSLKQMERPQWIKIVVLPSACALRPSVYFFTNTTNTDVRVTGYRCFAKRKMAAPRLFKTFLLAASFLVSMCVFFIAYLTSSSMGFGTLSIKRAGILLGIFVPVIFLISYFVVWRNLVLRPMKSMEKSCVQGVVFHTWTAALFVFLLFAHFSQLCILFLGKTTEVGTVSFVSFICFGALFVLAAVIFMFEIVEFFLKMTFQRGLSWEWFQENWLVIRAVMIVVISSCLVAVSVMNAAEGPVVKPVEIPVRKLPLSMHGLRIVQLSDIHLGPTVGKSQLQKSVNVANALKPDITVITGDLVDSTVENLVEAVSPLQQLRATHGVYYVTGNHEYYTYDVKHWLSHLKSLDIVCLSNSFVRIVHAQKPRDWFYLAGTNDIEGKRMYEKEHQFDLDKALASTDSDHAIILLAHQPKAAKQAVQSQYDISLILSGHTHGGQMFPITIPAYLFSPYFAGIYQPKEGTYVYVSSGTWYNGPPMRLFSRAEITLITLLAS
ncbi:transmembrane protein with metallophosphoesterase domain-like [Acanthaster planci]|uniref:Transmembrane protein with metallophosphoesterase domain-like n=1 Tax=Acanthaster planci TaxID=133434 RepID=A0A8B7YYF2_ACAPL|nr:transmembrane protein with metallophosphoesterase domain-like [Acanthaster planci]